MWRRQSSFIDPKRTRPPGGSRGRRGIAAVWHRQVPVGHDAHLILLAGVLLAVGVGASLLASALRVPALVLFLGVGVAVGSEGLGWIYLNDYRLTRLIGTVALVAILYEGGIQTGFRKLRPVLAPAASLAVVGTALTAVVTGLVAAWLFDLSIGEGLLLGAILSPTDGAAVFALLRGVPMHRRLVLILEGEAGFNDPVAVMLVIVMIKVVGHGGYSPLDAIWFFVHELVIAVVVGAAIGWLSVRGLGVMSSDRSGLSLVWSFATAALAYGAAGSIGGSGFLAVYVAALVVGSARLRQRDALTAFHEGLAGVAELGMFFTLGLLVFPSQLGGVLVRGTVLALVIALVARPLATFVATIGSRLRLSERALIGWAGLRGGVPVVLATLPVIDRVPRSVEFFDLVFFAVLISTLLQGTTVAPLAKMLKLRA
jgi:potassium/hydrogen antiporter